MPTSMARKDWMAKTGMRMNIACILTDKMCAFAKSINSGNRIHGITVAAKLSQKLFDAPE